jgi:AcrR family transcriptional regulator
MVTRLPIVDMSTRKHREKQVSRRKTPLQRRSKNTVDKLLNATELLLEELGQDRLTTILIAERAGLSVGALYEYFPNKQSILFALASRYIGMIEAVIANNEVEARGYSSWSQWYGRYMKEMISVYVQERGLVRYYDTLVTVPELRELDLKMDQLLMDYLKRSIAFFFPNTADDDLNILARMMITCVHNVLRFAVNLPKGSETKMLDNLNFIMQTLILKTVH